MACVVVGVAVLLGGPALRSSLAHAEPPPIDDMGMSLFDDPPAEANPPPVALSPAAPAELIVYVSGAVDAPDVYRLPEGARVIDAVLAAGGLRDDAVDEGVNLAATLSDAQHVHIPRQGEGTQATGESAAASAEQASSGGLIDLNRANAVDLEELPGIGQSIAARIIAYREQQGPFASVDDLTNVTGVGDALLAKISPLVTVGP